MSYLVFTQALAPGVDATSLAHNARRYFQATLEPCAGDPAAPSDSVRLELRDSRGARATFSVRSRPRTADDLVRARAAEQRGRAAGMAGLAERCGHVWLVEPESGSDDAMTLMLCAILASVALGPVLPPDDSTLFGVRGAMERVERLRDRLSGA